jgi:ribose transport system substrate-binding protein
MVQTMTRAVLSVAILVGAAVAAGPGAAADDAKKLIETAAKTTDASFCGTKPITLGVHDGFGINGWSRASMAAVRSEAAKCANVKQVPRIGQGDLQRSIGDVNGMVSQGVDAIAIIPDWGKSQLPSLRAATDAGVKTVPWAADPGGKDGKTMSSISIGTSIGLASPGASGSPRPSTVKAMSCSWVARRAIR